LGEEKLALSHQSYELVDHQIQRLDTDLKRFAEELVATGELAHGQDPKEAIKEKAHASGGSSSTAHKRSSTETYTVALPVLESNVPVDINEPTYCTCGRVSYGAMLGCDGPNCPIEWYHVECLPVPPGPGPWPPKGSWFCPTCEAERQAAAGPAPKKRRGGE
jgi:inhibitor of growth protein 4